MEPVYITGHKNPDTDSIVSAIAYAALRGELGDRQYVAARIGELSDETQHILDLFDAKPPLRLYNVKTQVKDLNYDHPPVLGCSVTVHRAFDTMQLDAEHSSALPVADDDGKLFGMVTAADIAAYDLTFVENARLTAVPLFNLVSSLDGQLWSSVPVTDVSGELVIALPKTEKATLGFPNGAIVLTGNEPSTLQEAFRCKASCVIICESQIDESAFCGSGDTVIIATPLDAYRAARLLIQSIPVSRVAHTEELVSFHLSDYVDEVRELTLKSRYRSYPILDETEHVAGTLSRYHLLRPNRKKVVLVDHNELVQSIPGLEQADILEIIDHHRLADVQTVAPVYVRNEPVGATCTIIASMYQERGVMPAKKVAGLLAAGIVSDTIQFKSPTCTERDRVMAERMARIAGLSLDELGREIFSANGTAGHDLKSLLFSDFKQFQIAGHVFGIGQITCTDSGEFDARRDEILKILEAERSARGYEMLLMMLTDVLKEGTLLLVVGDVATVEQAFNVKIENNAVFLAGVISRKKQVVPALSVLWG